MVRSARQATMPGDADFRGMQRWRSVDDAVVRGLNRAFTPVAVTVDEVPLVRDGPHRLTPLVCL